MNRWIDTGPAAERESVPWSGPARLALIVLIVGALLLLAFLVHPWYDPKNDSSMYIAAARAIAAGEGYSYLEMPFHLRPPGFSLLIAPIVGLAGANFLALNLFVSLWGVLGIVLLFAYLRPRVGWPLALLAALAVWLNPGYQRFCTQVMSDAPGTALFLGCLLLERWAARTSSWKRDLVLGLAIGLSTYVRTISVLLLPAIVVAWVLERLLGRDRHATWASVVRRLVIVVAACWIVLLPWSVRNHYRAPPPPADQTSLYDYSTSVFHVDKGDPASPRVPMNEILARIPARGADIATSLVSRMQSEEGGGHRGLALLIAAAWLYVLVKRRAPSDFFVAGALFVMALYPVFQDRLIIPVYMLAIGSVTETLRDLLRRAVSARFAPAIVAGALVLLIAIDFKPRHGWDLIESAHQRFEQECELIESRLPPTVRLGAATGWHYNVCLGRSVYGLKHTFFREGTGDPIERAIDKYRIETLVLSDRDLVARSLLPQFQKNYTEIERVGDLTFIEVRPTR